MGELERFRTGLFGCLRRWGDALFELTDAVLCAPGALHSVPSLSLEPEFRRSHGSLYKALAGGRIDEMRSAGCSSSIAPPTGRWCSPWTPRRGIGATPSAALSGASTTRRRSTPPANPSSLAGTTSGSASSTGRPTAGRRRWTCGASRHRPTQPPRRSSKFVTSSSSSAMSTRCRCSSSTPATTRSPSVTTSPTCAAKCCAASVTTVSSTPTRRRAPTVRPEPVDGRHDTDHGSPAHSPRRGRNPPAP